MGHGEAVIKVEHILQELEPQAGGVHTVHNFEDCAEESRMGEICRCLSKLLSKLFSIGYGFVRHEGHEFRIVIHSNMGIAFTCTLVPPRCNTKGD